MASKPTLELTTANELLCSDPLSLVFSSLMIHLHTVLQVIDD